MARSQQIESASSRGEEPDRWDRWRVERVLEVVRVQTRRRKVLARIRWVGIDQRTRLPWKDSWVDVNWGMTSDAGAEVDALLRAKYGDQEALRPRKEKKRRRQAEASARAPDARVEAAQAGWKRRWGVLRSRGERTEAEDGGEGCKLRRIVQRSRKARRVVEDDEED